MKRFLTILGAMTLTASMAATVVACANEGAPADPGDSDIFKAPISDVIPITKLDKIEVPAGAKPTLKQIIDALNVANGYVNPTGQSLNTLADDTEPAFDDPEVPFQLNPNDFEIKSETDSSATIVAKSDAEEVKGDTTVEWTPVVRPMVPLSTDLTVKSGITIKTATKEALLAQLQSLNPNLAIDEIVVGDLKASGTPITVKTGSVWYNAGTTINVTYTIESRSSLKDVITNTDLGSILSRNQSPADLVTLLMRQNPDLKFTNPREIYNFIIVRKFSTGMKSFMVILTEKDKGIRSSYVGDITITYNLNFNGGGNGGNGGNNNQGQWEVGAFVRNHFLGALRQADLNEATLMDKIVEKNPNLNRDDFKVVIEYHSAFDRHPLIYIIGKDSTIYNSRSRVVFSYALIG